VHAWLSGTYRFCFLEGTEEDIANTAEFLGSRTARVCAIISSSVLRSQTRDLYRELANLFSNRVPHLAHLRHDFLIRTGEG